MTPAQVLFWHRRAVSYFGDGKGKSAAPGSAVESRNVQQITHFVNGLRGNA